MRTAPLQDKVRILTDCWPAVVVKERSVLSADERRHAMVAMNAAVLGRGGVYGLVLDFRNPSTDGPPPFARSAGRTERRVAVTATVA